MCFYRFRWIWKYTYLTHNLMAIPYHIIMPYRPYHCTEFQAMKYFFNVDQCCAFLKSLSMAKSQTLLRPVSGMQEGSGASWATVIHWPCVTAVHWGTRLQSGSRMLMGLGAYFSRRGSVMQCFCKVTYITEKKNILLSNRLQKVTYLYQKANYNSI